VKLLIVSSVALLAGCASLDYQPVQERSFAQVASGRCKEGERMLVTGQVSRSYENTVVMWDGIDPQATVAVTLPKPGIKQRVRGWFGGDTSREVSDDTLSDLAARGVPVTVNLVCHGDGVAPEALQLSYTDAQGQRVAIAY
jgi:hypothetical protein